MTDPRPAAVRLVPVRDHLPAGFARLREEARAEGFSHIERLAAEWESGTLRFDRPGELLLAAETADALGGLGGLTIEAALPDTLRLRRFYVRSAFRRFGIGRAIAKHLVDHARQIGCGLTLNALTPEACAFWERLGFQPDPRRLGFTHARRD